MKIYLRPHNHGSIGWSLDLNRFLYLDKNYSKKVNKITLAELKKHSKDVSLQIKSPLEISWHITSKCDMNCEYCFAPKNLPDSVKCENTILKELNKYRVLRVNISGGEPFLHPRLLKVLKQLKKNGHWVSITTNGYIAGNFINKVSSFVDQIMVSIDSLDKDELRRFKGSEKEDLLEKVIQTIQKCSQFKIPVRTSTLITKRHHQNPKELETFVKKVREWGVTELSMIQFVPRGKAKYVKDKYALTNEEYFDIVEAYQNKFNTQSFRIISRNLDRYKGYLVIQPNGDVYTLDKQSEDKKVGNILNQDLKNIFPPIVLTFYKL